MRILSCDCETTTFSKGNPFDSRNKLCLVGLYDGDHNYIYDIEYSDSPYREALEEIQELIDNSDLLVFLNAQFDINHLRNYGIKVDHKRIWETQVCHFILSNQTTPYPSLNGVAEYYGLGTKIDKIAEYWDQGIQTTDIDYDELSEYLAQDLNLTLQIYYKQLEELESKPHLKSLVNVSNYDTLVLADMVYQGLKYDFALSEKRAKELEEKLQHLDSQLADIYSIDGLNWNSSDHLSAILYGGVLKVPCRVKTERILKDGTIKYGEKNGVQEVVMERLVDPLKGSECIKEGYWKTAEDILKSLRAKGKAKKIIDLVLQRSLIDKELTTYALGLPKLYAEKHYTDEIIHGQLNQTVARTGRLSSSSPNCQNLSDGAKRCIITRF